MEKGCFHISIGDSLEVFGKLGGDWIALQGKDASRALNEEFGELSDGWAQIILPIGDLPALAAVIQRLYLLEVVESYYNEL